MNNYINYKMIKELRESKGLTQAKLADILGVSDKTISKWETGRGLPDISIIEPLALSLGISIIELMNGEYITNNNKSANMLKSVFKVCPICGNVMHSIGDNTCVCCGVNLPSLQAESEDEKHMINIEKIENEYYVSIRHDMTKEHYISFITYVTNDRCDIVKLYPEGNAEARFLRRGKGYIYVYCNIDGLYKKVAM